MHGRLGEVLEVVEIQKRTGSVQRVGDRLQEPPTSGLAYADRTGDRARHQVRVGDRRQPHEVHRSLDRRGRGDLEREAALAGASGTGDGHQPHLRRAQQRFDSLERLGSTHEAVVERRQARR